MSQTNSLNVNAASFTLSTTAKPFAPPKPPQEQIPKAFYPPTHPHPNAPSYQAHPNIPVFDPNMQCTEVPQNSSHRNVYSIAQMYNFGIDVCSSFCIHSS